MESALSPLNLWKWSCSDVPWISDGMPFGKPFYVLVGKASSTFINNASLSWYVLWRQPNDVYKACLVAAVPDQRHGQCALIWHWLHIDGLVQERRNTSALEMELSLSCISPSICSLGEQCIHMHTGDGVVCMHTLLLSWVYALVMNQRRLHVFIASIAQIEKHISEYFIYIRYSHTCITKCL